MQLLRLGTLSLGFILFLAFNNNCGGGGGDDDDDSTTSSSGLGIEASVTTPSLTGSLTVPRSSLGRAIGLVSSSRVTETATAGAIVHAEDLSGTEIGTACETGADGTCTVTELTEAQLDAGCVLVYEYTNDAGNSTEVHAPVFLDPNEVAAVVAGGTHTEPINTETDIIHAIAEEACSGTLDGCDGITLNILVLIESTAAMITGETPSDLTTIDAAMQALYETHATTIAEATTGVIPAEALEAALGGDTTALVAEVGATVDAFDATFDTATIVADAGLGASTTIETYAGVNDTTWVDLKAANADFNPAAIVGCIFFLPPTGLADFAMADFKEVAKAIPEVEGGFSIMANTEAKQTCAESFKQGLYTGVAGDSAKAGTAFGTMMATFPPCPAEGCAAMASTHFTAINFNYETAGLAAFNGFFALGTGINYADFNPMDMRETLNSTFMDNMQSFAIGGGASFFGAMASAGSIGSFVPATFVGQIKGAPGESCTASTDCLPCDSCTGGQCVAGSSKMGAACSSDSDCDDLTACRTGYIASLGGVCMCASVIPAGAPVMTSAGSGPTSYTPPTAGSMGAACGTGLPACSGGTSCSGTTFGTCVSSTFKKGPYMPCSASSECESNSCSGGVCTISSTAAATLKSVGEGCSTPSECASFMCNPTTHLCEVPPTTGILAGATTGLKADGLTCAMPGECASAFCCMSTLKCSQSSSCTPPSGGGPTGGGSGFPIGSPCGSNPECTTGVCLGGFCGI